MLLFKYDKYLLYVYEKNQNLINENVPSYTLTIYEPL